ncbi:MAG: ABC transporter permease, partial [bacterium]|nr:ABC transporter permease [bacterium]
IIYIPNHFRTNFLLGKHPQIKIQSTGDYQASFAEMMLERYIKVASIYRVSFDNEEEIVKQVQDVLSKTVKIEMTSKLNTNQLSRVSFYYNFANYSILAGCVYVICLVLSSFKEKNIQKRTIISSTNYRKYNQILLLSNSLFAFILWGIYVLLSFILLGNIMFTIHGLIYIMNSFVFTFCALTIAFLIGNLVSSKEAINGIVNVVALGSSFLCGSFVPMEWLPNSVLKIAQILPSYWYIKTNEVVKTLEVIDFASLKPIIIHLFILILFAIGFMILTNLISMKKQKID